MLSVWHGGDREGSDCHLLVATEEAIFRLNIDYPHTVIKLLKFSAKVTATHILTDCLTVMQHSSNCDKAAQNYLKIEILDLVSLTATTVASLPVSSPSPTWLLVLSRHHLSPKISKLVNRLAGDTVYFVGGHGSPTVALTASDQAIEVDFSIKSRWQFLQKHMTKPHTIKAVTSFSELAVTLTQRRNAGDGNSSEINVRRGLLDVIEVSGRTFLLAECGDLWEGGRLVLRNVGGLESAKGVLVVWTFDGAIYTFSDQDCSKSVSSVLQILPGFEGKGGIVSEVAAAAKVVTRLGEEEEKRREEIDQMRLATLMLGDMSVFEQQVEVTYGWGEGRGVQVELSNTSGQELKGEFWKVHLEVGP